MTTKKYMNTQKQKNEIKEDDKKTKQWKKRGDNQSCRMHIT